MTMGSLEGQRGRAFQRGVSFGVGGEGHGSTNDGETTNHATEEGRASEKLGRGGGGDEEAAEVAWRDNELLNAAHVGRESFSSTHLSFSPAPASHHDMMNAESYNKSKADQTGNGKLNIHRHTDSH